MYCHQVWLDKLTLVALLTINSFSFPFPHKIGGSLDVLLCLIVISYSVFFSDWLKKMKGNYSAALINHKKFHYWYKVIQVAHESRDCTQSIWIIFSVFFYFHQKKKERGKLTNCDNGSWKSLLSHGLNSLIPSLLPSLIKSAGAWMYFHTLS